MRYLLNGYTFSELAVMGNTRKDLVGFLPSMNGLRRRLSDHETAYNISTKHAQNRKLANVVFILYRFRIGRGGIYKPERCYFQLTNKLEKRTSKSMIIMKSNMPDSYSQIVANVYGAYKFSGFLCVSICLITVRLSVLGV